MTIFTNVDWVVNIFAAEFYGSLCYMLPFGSSGWRGTRVFRNKSTCVDEVLVYVGVGEKQKGVFEGIDLHHLHRTWMAILNGGWHRKFVKRVFWMHL